MYNGRFKEIKARFSTVNKSEQKEGGQKFHGKISAFDDYPVCFTENNQCPLSWLKFSRTSSIRTVFYAGLTELTFLFDCTPRRRAISETLFSVTLEDSCLCNYSFINLHAMKLAFIPHLSERLYLIFSDQCRTAKNATFELQILNVHI